MSETTKIEWATSTGNPWTGCRKVSPGCVNCYMFEWKKRWGKDGTVRTRTKAFWKDAIRWNKDAESAARGWQALQAMKRDGMDLTKEVARYGMTKPERPRIFPSLCDWLDDEVPIDWLADFLKLIHDTPNLDWLLLTKRPENWALRISEAAGWHRDCGDNRDGEWLRNWRLHGAPPSNVWIGTSVEDQKRADERIPALFTIPAKVRFLSAEPLLGPIDFGLWLKAEFGRLDESFKLVEPHQRKFNWVIVGGESGRKARACSVDWIRSIVAQCKDAGVPCFVKQLGTYAVLDGRPGELSLKDTKGGNPAEWPENLRVREFPR
jgi:protein gp37